MPDKKIMLLCLSRMLTSKKQADLLAWVQLAYTAECSVKKSLDTDVTVNEVPSQQTWEYSCEKSLIRRRK